MSFHDGFRYKIAASTPFDFGAKNLTPYGGLFPVSTMLEKQVEERMSRADLYRDLPRGRKRRGWKKEFLESLVEAAKDIGEVSEEDILRTVRSYRRERRAPEITVAAER